jgi:hypothetical protein
MSGPKDVMNTLLSGVLRKRLAARLPAVLRVTAGRLAPQERDEPSGAA